SPSPPKGRTFDRLTSMNRNRLANPLAVSGRGSLALSSSTGMWPMIEMWAAVAESDGEPLVMVETLRPAHAVRIHTGTVFPGRSAATSALANSGSVTIRRLSEMPGSTISHAPSFPFHFLNSSRTSLMSPSLTGGQTTLDALAVPSLVRDPDNF